jgi:hypothetical protein
MGDFRMGVVMGWNGNMGGFYSRRERERGVEWLAMLE